jgi:hypothetical protein
VVKLQYLNLIDYGGVVMQKMGTSNIVIFAGEKGREIFEKISNTKPKAVDHEKKAQELQKKLEKQGVRFEV